MELSPADDRNALRADCGSCFALCCVALPFSASGDFALDKAAGTPCPNLRGDFGCGIHARLREESFAGCAVFDCFGAGQKIAQHTFGGRDWRQAPHTARRMFDTFGVMRQLHELLWYLADALARPAAASIHGELRAGSDRVHRCTLAGAEELQALDVAGHRHRIDGLLVRTSELVRVTIPGPRANHRGADLAGRNFHGADLRGAHLRGAWLMAADLAGAELAAADVLGADLRDTDVRCADLSEALFLTQAQVNAARGDRDTRLPTALSHPAHW